MKRNPEKLRKLKHKSPKTYSGKLFEGVLLDPIQVPYFPNLTNLDSDVNAKLVDIREQVRINADRQLVERLQALIDHYAIEQNGNTAEIFFRLAKSLAEDFLPGFQRNLPLPTTRPQGLYTVGGEDLFRAVTERAWSKRETVKDACIYLSRHSGKWHAHSPKALETAYHRYYAQAQEEFFAMHAHEVYGPLIRLLGFNELMDQIKKTADKTNH